MSDYYEYYQNNPQEGYVQSFTEQQEQLEEAMLDAFDDLKPSDYIDFGFDYDLDAFNAVIKGIALAYYNGDDAQLLTYAKSAGKMMITQIEQYVEKKL